MICITFLEKSWKNIHGNRKQDKNFLGHMRAYACCAQKRGSISTDAGVSGKILEDGQRLLPFQQGMDPGKESGETGPCPPPVREKKAFLQQIFSIDI